MDSTQSVVLRKELFMSEHGLKSTRQAYTVPQEQSYRRQVEIKDIKKVRKELDSIKRQYPEIWESIEGDRSYTSFLAIEKNKRLKRDPVQVISEVIAHAQNLISQPIKKAKHETNTWTQSMENIIGIVKRRETYTDLKSLAFYCLK